MANARGANDNVQGWGMDFDNPNQEAALEDKQNAMKFTNYEGAKPTKKNLEDAQMQEAIAQSLNTANDEAGTTGAAAEKGNESKAESKPAAPQQPKLSQREVEK